MVTLLYRFSRKVLLFCKLSVMTLSCSVCGQGQWDCTDEPCPGTCQVYGNGHYQTFDAKWYRFGGHCQYTLVEVRARKITKHECVHMHDIKFIYNVDM